MSVSAPAPAVAVEQVRAAVNRGDYPCAQAMYATLSETDRDRLLARLRRLTAPALHGPSYGALSARLRGVK